MSRQRGILVAFEGGDRCGKSTQCAMLQEALYKSGYEQVGIIRFPQRGTPVGQLIDKYLSGSKVEIASDQAVHLLFSANRWEMFQEMYNRLEAGEIIILDRYIASGIAYSIAKGLDSAWCCLADTGLIAPDVTFHLDLAVEQAERRENYGEERFENATFQQKVDLAYKAQQHCYPQPWITLDADQSPQQLHQDILSQVLSILYRKISLPWYYFNK